MVTIYKFPLRVVDCQQANVPAGAIPLHAGLDPSDIPCIWMKVDSKQPLEPFRVYIIGTGNSVPELADQHVGSFTQGPFVWHVFVEGRSL